MKEISSSNFGLAIAYLIPGVTALWGTSYVSMSIRVLMGSPPDVTPTVGGFLYLTLASVTSGLTVSTVRWAFVDTAHHWTGIPRPRWDFSRLQQNIAAFDRLIEIHYRYYQFYAGMLVALLYSFVVRRSSIGFFSGPFGWIDIAQFVLVVTFYFGSRDTLRKYYERVAQLLSAQ